MEIIGLCTVKHENEIKELTEELKLLKEIIQNMNKQVSSLEQNVKENHLENIYKTNNDNNKDKCSIKT